MPSWITCLSYSGGLLDLYSKQSFTFVSFAVLSQLTSLVVEHKIRGKSGRQAHPKWPWQKRKKKETHSHPLSQCLFFVRVARAEKIKRKKKAEDRKQEKGPFGHLLLFFSLSFSRRSLTLSQEKNITISKIVFKGWKDLLLAFSLSSLVLFFIHSFFCGFCFWVLEKDKVWLQIWL